MAVRGVSMAHWQTMHNKTLLMGATLNEAEALDLRGGGYQRNQDIDPLQQVYDDHAELSAFDRADTYLSLVANDGEVRMRRRQPIATTLTPEIYDPRRPHVSSTITVNKHIPNYSNDAQVKQAMRHIDEQTQESQSLRQHYGVPFYNRAPGQSFRYE